MTNRKMPALSDAEVAQFRKDVISEVVAGAVAEGVPTIEAHELAEKTAGNVRVESKLGGPEVSVVFRGEYALPRRVAVPDAVRRVVAAHRLLAEHGPDPVHELEAALVQGGMSHDEAVRAAEGLVWREPDGEVSVKFPRDTVRGKKWIPDLARQILRRRGESKDTDYKPATLPGVEYSV